MFFVRSENKGVRVDAELHAIKYSVLGSAISKLFNKFHFAHSLAQSKWRIDCLPMNSYNLQQQSQQMYRKQSARTQNSSKMKHAFTASLNGTTHRMPSQWPVSVAITIISIKWLSNNYIKKFFFFFYMFFVQRPPHVAVFFFFLPCAADTCMHAGNWMRAMCTHSKSIDWPNSSSG